MFTSVVNFLENMTSTFNGEDPSVVDQTKIAITALLFQVIPIDGIVRDEEKQRLNQILRDDFKVSSDDLNALIERAKREHFDTGGLYPFTQHLVEHCTKSQRKHIVFEMWQIALSDNELHEMEEALIERTAELLGVDTAHPLLLN
jgi:uncharacterized tellurite resistance protein B-like protein